MDDPERIIASRNRVYPTNNGLATGKGIPNALKTDENHVYRVTGMNQIKDILACGYIRPREGKLSGGHKNEIFWSKGSDKLFYFCYGNVILEAPADKVVDNQIGAIPLDDLSAIWQFNQEKNVFENRIDFYYQVYEEVHNEIEHKTK